ncbi:putative Pyrroline-5-carboxylate reductase dimerization domain-containing protein [Seiridium unicorne]|uniref:Pyrroline-5-carboxylate reductase dimerization domain-containing protein n=1 Tax=Seiridium unicorne TaxID=138068 RepID=A0ABR2UWK9_9PEZI
MLKSCADFVTDGESRMIDGKFRVYVDTLDFGHIMGEVELTELLQSVGREYGKEEELGREEELDKEMKLKEKMDQEIEALFSHIYEWYETEHASASKSSPTSHNTSVPGQRVSQDRECPRTESVPGQRVSQDRECPTALGLPEEQALRLSKQTCVGAGRMLVESSDSPSQLRVNVTSPNGTTKAALKSFKESHFQQIVDKAVNAAVDRGEELGKETA